MPASLLLVFGFAVLAELLVRRILLRLLPKFPPRRSDAVPVRVLFALLNLIFDALPVVVFAAVAYTAIAMALDPFSPTRITLSVLADATVETRLVLCLARALLLPIDGGTLVVQIDVETRNYLYIWIKRFVAAGLYGYAIPEAAWWLGIPGAIYALLLNLAGLVLALLAIVFLLQNRATIARWISGGDRNASGWGRVRRTLGEIWHILVILYVIGIYLIYALRIEGGFAYVLRATVASLVIIVAAQLLVRSMQGLSRRGFAIAPDLKARYPTLEHRANRYVPAFTFLARPRDLCRGGPVRAASLGRSDLRLARFGIGAAWRSDARRRSARWSSSLSRRGNSSPPRSNGVCKTSTVTPRRGAPGCARCCRCCAPHFSA